MLNILPKVSSLPGLLDINLTKVKIQIFQRITWSHFRHLIKGSCLGASYTKSAVSLIWCPYIFCRWKNLYCFHMTPQDHLIEVSSIFMGESPSQHVSTLKRLVAIDILVVKRKDASPKSWILQVLTATTVFYYNTYCHWKTEIIG